MIETGSEKAGRGRRLGVDFPMYRNWSPRMVRDDPRGLCKRSQPFFMHMEAGCPYRGFVTEEISFCGTRATCTERPAISTGAPARTPPLSRVQPEESEVRHMGVICSKMEQLKEFAGILKSGLDGIPAHFRYPVGHEEGCLRYGGEEYFYLNKGCFQTSEPHFGKCADKGTSGES